jgi:predicted transcriptional regulator
MPDLFATSVRLPAQLKADLVKIAKAQGCSITWLINDVLGKWVVWKKEQDKKK